MIRWIAGGMLVTSFLAHPSQCLIHTPSPTAVSTTPPQVGRTVAETPLLARLDERARLIGARVLDKWPFPRRRIQYNFRAVESTDANAAAAATADVFVTRRVIEELKSDDELAAVMAHEIAHVENRHAYRLWRAAERASILWNLASPDFRISDTYDVVRSETLIPPLRAFLSGIVRELEDEADLYAAVFLYCSGRTPSALADALQKLSLLQPDAGAAQLRPGAFATHSPTSERIQDLRRVQAGEIGPITKVFHGLSKSGAHLATLVLHFQRNDRQWSDILASVTVTTPADAHDNVPTLELQFTTGRTSMRPIPGQVALGETVNVVFRSRQSVPVINSIVAVRLPLKSVVRWTDVTDRYRSALVAAGACVGLNPALIGED